VAKPAKYAVRRSELLLLHKRVRLLQITKVSYLGVGVHDLLCLVEDDDAFVVGVHDEAHEALICDVLQDTFYELPQKIVTFYDAGYGEKEQQEEHAQKRDPARHLPLRERLDRRKETQQQGRGQGAGEKSMAFFFSVKVVIVEAQGVRAPELDNLAVEKPVLGVQGRSFVGDVKRVGGLPEGAEHEAEADLVIVFMVPVRGQN